MQIIDYWSWKNILSLDEIKKINSFIENNYEWKEDAETWATGDNGERKKYTDTKLITWGKVKHLLQDIEDKSIWTATKEFGYNVYPFNNLDQMFHNTYALNEKYDWHVDSSRSNQYDVKLSMIINMSEEPYEGGQFHLFIGGDKVCTELDSPGSAILFKSFLNHKVSPVTKGVRKSLAIFLDGPKFT